MNISQKNTVFFLSGRLDEFADFSLLEKASPPLKINFGGVTSINSIGVRRFLIFSLAWSPRTFEFYECTPEFIANLNVIPQLLGKSADETQIKTFYVPFSCEFCKRVENVLFDRAMIVRGAEGDVVLPKKICVKCHDPMVMDVDQKEFFLFLSAP